MLPEWSTAVCSFVWVIVVHESLVCPEQLIWKWKRHYIRLHTNLCSAFNPSKVHAHTVNTHPEQWAARGAVGGSVPCSRSLLSWYWVWRERYLFTPSNYNTCQPETRTPIRPRLPQICLVFLKKNYSGATNYLVFSAFLCIWTLSNNYCMILRSIFSHRGQPRDSNAHWCSRKTMH